MLRNRLTKLEKIQQDKERGDGGIYLVFDDPNSDKMEITRDSNLIFSGSIEEGEKVIKELERPGDFIVRTSVTRECAQ